MTESETATIDLGRRCNHKTAKVTYVPKEVSLANDVPDEEDESIERDWDAPSEVAVNLCKLVTAWDITGSLEHRRTNEVLVAEGVTVPLDPMIVQHLPWRVMSGVMSGVTLAENPNPSRPRRKR